MPYKDKEKQLEYQKNWMRKRRKSFFSDKECNHCGSTEDLELDHINRLTKITHNVWSWSEDRRNDELKKCQVLCNSCHTKKTSNYNSIIMKGSEPGNKKYSDDYIYKVKKEILNTDLTLKEISLKFDIPYQTIRDISSGRRYVNVGEVR
jgi:hypothetical protein